MCGGQQGSLFWFGVCRTALIVKIVNKDGATCLWQLRFAVAVIRDKVVYVQEGRTGRCIHFGWSMITVGRGEP